MTSNADTFTHVCAARHRLAGVAQSTLGEAEERG
jgi:hypothetical protein